MPTKILAIDDDSAMTELLTLLLKSHGFEVTTTNSGEKGFELIQQIKPDVILLDLMMPKMDGWETCKKIRKFCKTPIVVLSALNNPGMVASALDAGADDYLIKPVPSSILVAHIKNLTRRNTAQLNPSKSMMRTQKKPVLSS
ncbi:MAG: response regulator [Chloroflexi bacterium]|nr:response regulator [Chloroflexota bacterium]